MSINVTEIVLHQLIQKEAEVTELTTLLRENLLEITPEVDQMMLQLHQAYQGKAKGYGVFQETSIFAQELNRLLEQETDFLPFSHHCAKMLATELAKYPFAGGGTFILCRYNFLATEYLFIALIDNRASILVDDKLEIKRTQYLEMAQYDIACRINLTELKLDAQSNRYLTFIKGRVGRKVADFFMDFLGAEAGLDPKVQNQTLLQAVHDYCDQGELSTDQTRAVKAQVFDYCKGQMNSGEEIAISALANEIPTLNEQNFSQFTQSQDYGLEETIPPVRNTLKTLTKYSGSGKGITLSFDAQLLNQRIIWDELNDTLTIKEIPPNLRDQLQRNK
ncbi:nucleoid-associated protein YejK [Pasteurella skyensis]|uniref:Nucleoid-associated protein QJU93_06790 n=1 Tax=Phocoenobacter skyensis TaxID=97481 RepID=A0AAJ6NAB9_9PAST|nr:nucleoid-associated protein YejK [Pasteurella skyensis]MDP8163118.1 nucleoid-associated protein YejK [Pasteurella skyensis]MDP8173061.1 nucleoid-associated protein YejK [Pasteurella skyensis]MDP8177159.1 nucleoid-associated protein YejK [Pasteurella skyensis]MDP8179623.1 nucleoid-associated protein YejK [Pasteurella skyensis]MDP8183812.1 nucleoid-associated protein YejK [Pasteurella skyensis]